jgi:hypothetical protein
MRCMRAARKGTTPVPPPIDEDSSRSNEMRRTIPILLALALMALPAAAFAYGSGGRQYEVTITNVTKGQTFTPILVATHSRYVSIFEAGEPAGDELEILAEAGDTGPMTEALLELGRQVGDVETSAGLRGPGESVTVKVRAGRGHRSLSVAAMLIPTNDTFLGATSISLPSRGARTVDVPAYDAGTEANDQSCANMPGPRCGGAGHSPGPNPGDEGFVYIGNGFHELGSEDEDGAEVLGPLTYDWRNPVARVHVERVC